MFLQTENLWMCSSYIWNQVTQLFLSCQQENQDIRQRAARNLHKDAAANDFLQKDRRLQIFASIYQSWKSLHRPAVLRVASVFRWGTRFPDVRIYLSLSPVRSCRRRRTDKNTTSIFKRFLNNKIIFLTFPSQTYAVCWTLMILLEPTISATAGSLRPRETSSNVLFPQTDSSESSTDSCLTKRSSKCWSDSND